MRQLYFLVVSAIDSIPDEAEYILRCTFRVAIDLLHSLLCVNALLMTGVNEACKLMQFSPSQEPNVHEIDERAAVLQLLSSFVKVLV